MIIYVEGGGNDNKCLHTECRQGFTKFLEKAGVAKKPRIVACGGRNEAYERFCIAVETGKPAMLLVDSEGVVITEAQKSKNMKQWQPWMHLTQYENSAQNNTELWKKPKNTEDWQCHLMVVCMESWFLADPSALKSFFGQGFKENQLQKLLSKQDSVEKIQKEDIYKGLKHASKDCESKGTYKKGEHSFKLLARIDPAKVKKASPWAARFFDILRAKM